MEPASKNNEISKSKSQNENTSGKKKSSGDNSKKKLKTPKDFGPEQMAVREKVIGVITETFKRHGAVTIDTPVFELRDVLMGKYGEEGSKLVYDLADQGGEICSLRYDLTVPFARYLAANKIEKIKRYQIAKVYRRDQPVMTKGRYREFYQCDFDIAGPGEIMVQEAECLKVVDEVMTALDIGECEIRINSRPLLEGMFAVCSIPEGLFKAACSSIDKLDKQPWEEIRKELIDEKKVDEQAVDALGEMVGLRDRFPDWDNNAILDWFAKEQWNKNGAEELSSIEAVGREKIKKAVEEIRILVEYANLFGCSPKRVIFHPSLARGLDYYTGIIYEVVMKDFSFTPEVTSPRQQVKTTVNNEDQESEDSSSGNLGSVAAGGRYDKLVGMFMEGTGKGKGKVQDVPCVGISFGIERLFTIMEMKGKAKQEKENEIRVLPTDVYVASVRQSGEDPTVFVRERMRICAALWNGGIRTEMSYKPNPKLLEQIQYCERNKVPLMVLFGGDELSARTVKLRDIAERKDEVVSITELVKIIQERLNISYKIYYC